MARRGAALARCDKGSAGADGQRRFARRSTPCSTALSPPPLLAGGLGGRLSLLLDPTRRPALVVLFGLAVGALYAGAPSRRRRRDQMRSWGTFAATGLRVMASAWLPLDASRAAGFGAVRGSPGAGVGLMLWFDPAALAGRR